MAEYIERTEELVLAMNAGARAIENTKRYHGTVYNKDVFSESPQEIPYLQAAKVLREVSDTSAADVAPVVHARWDDSGRYTFPGGSTAVRCTECGCALTVSEFRLNRWNYCPVCGAKMDGDDNTENVRIKNV